MPVALVGLDHSIKKKINLYCSVHKKRSNPGIVKTFKYALLMTFSFFRVQVIILSCSSLHFKLIFISLVNDP